MLVFIIVFLVFIYIVVKVSGKTHTNAPRTISNRKEGILAIRNSNMVDEAEGWFINALDMCATDCDRAILYLCTQTSVIAGFPYCCETERELEILKNLDMNIYNDDAYYMRGLIHQYCDGSLANTSNAIEKKNFWVKKIVDKVKRGDYDAVVEMCILKNKGQYLSEFPEEVMDSCNIQTVIDAANNHDPYAALAWGAWGIDEFCPNATAKDKIPFLRFAAESGLTDGCYYLTRTMWEELCPNLDDYSRKDLEPARKELEKTERKLFKMASKYDNGNMVGECEYWLGRYYEPNPLITKSHEDEEQSIFWYKKAAEHYHFDALYKFHSSEMYNPD